LNSNDIRFTSDGGNTWSIQIQVGTRFRNIFFVEQKYGWAVGRNGLLVHTTNGGGVFPSTPELVYPVYNQQLTSDSVNLVWISATPEITDYSINISNDSLFINFTDTLVTDTSLMIMNLELNAKYYWRVKAKNEISWGDYSETGSFLTSITGIGDSYENKIEFGLKQNFPNPFNPTTKIKYSIPHVILSEAKNLIVILKVYDVLGREAATLVNEEKQPGVYEVEFDASNLSSGAYFYRLQTGEFIETKKLILMK
jgi:hypothetical protein